MDQRVIKMIEVWWHPNPLRQGIRLNQLIRAYKMQFGPDWIYQSGLDGKGR